MRDESEWRQLFNAFFYIPPEIWERACVCLFVCVGVCVYFCESIESSLKDKEHCLRCALVMLCAVFSDFSHSLKLPLLFQYN